MPFDPNKPFEVVETTATKGAEGFDPNKPFEVVSEESGQAAGFDPNKPFEAVTEEAPPEEGTAFKSLPITDQEVELIAKKHGLKPEEMDSLRDHMIWRGAMLSSTTGVGQEVKSIAGALSSDILGNIPQKIAAMQESEPMQQAIDEADELIHSKRSWSEAAAGFAGGLLLPGTALGKAATAVKSVPKAMALMGAEGALMGGLAGFGESKTGEELTSTAIGAGLGAGLGASLHGLVSSIKGVDSGKLNKLVREVEERPDVMEKITKEMASEETELLQHTIAMVSEVPTKEEKGAKIADSIIEAIQTDDDFAERLVNYAEKTFGGASETDIERAVNYLAGEVKDFGQAVIGRGATKASVTESDLLNAIQKTKSDRLDYVFDMWRKENIITGKLADDLQKDIIATSEGAHRKSLGLVTALKAARFVATQIDNRIPGMDVTGLIDKYSMQNKRSTLYIKHFTKEFDEVNKKFLDLTGGDERKMQAFYDVMTAEGEEKAAKEAQEGAKAEEIVSRMQELIERHPEFYKQAKELGKEYSKLWEEARLAANDEAGRELFAKTQHYVHKKAVARVEGIAKIESWLDTLKKNGLDLLNLDNETAAKKLKSFILDTHAAKGVPIKDSLVDIIRSVNFYAGDDTIIKSSNLLRKFDANVFRENYQRMIHPPTADMHLEGIKARASMERTGGIPDLILEKRLPKLTQAWVRDAARDAFLGDTIRELQHNRNIIQNLQDKHSAEYITNLVADLSGGRSNTFSGIVRQWTEEQQVELLRRSMQYPEGSVKRGAYELSAQFPRFFNAMLQQCYPSFLGLHNPTAAITNLVAPLFTTIPEVGWNYGSTILPKAYMGILTEATNAGGLGKWLEKEGFKGAEWSTDIASALGDPISKHATLRVAKKTLENYNKLMMSAFAASENANIALAVKMADTIVDDIIKGANKDDISRFLSRVPDSVRSKIVNTLGDYMTVGAKTAPIDNATLREARDIIRKHLVAKTVLNYDKANMSSFARAAGPIFSMFTRWPTAVLGDIIEQYQVRGFAGGSGEILRKYMAPVIMLTLLNEQTDKDSDVRKFLTGSGREGFVKYAPLTSLAGLAEGKFASPPALQPVKAIAPLVRGDFEEAGKTFIKAASGFIPFAAPIHKAIDFATE